MFVNLAVALLVPGMEADEFSGATFGYYFHILSS